MQIMSIFFTIFLYTNCKIALFLRDYILKLDGTSPRVSIISTKLTHFPLFALSLAFSLSSILRSHDRRIDKENKSSLFLGTSLARSFLSLAPHVLLSLSLFFSLARTPSLTRKHAYKHALAHADTQKCPTNTHSRNFSELRYLDKNITAV